MKTVVQFGAGNIGRGFMGQLFFESGYHTVFVDVDPAVIDGLNARGAYPLRIAAETSRDLTIKNVSAVHAGDGDGIADALAEAVWAATAVGAAAVPAVCRSLAAGLAHRFQTRPEAGPLNIILCENMLDASATFRREILAHLSAEHHDAFETKIGLVEASIGRMVPIMTAAHKAEDPLLVCAEPYCQLPVDADGLKKPCPRLAHLLPKAPFRAYVERKLFMHNAGHAAAAYLGYLRGYEYIWQAVADTAVRSVVLGAMTESASALAALHGVDSRELADHAADLVARFGNRALGDQVVRVARDPIRKLGPNDRLIAAGRACQKAGVDPTHIAFAAAAAIEYDQADDKAAQTLQSLRKADGYDAVLREICGLEPDEPLAALIRTSAARLREEGWLTRVEA